MYIYFTDSLSFSFADTDCSRTGTCLHFAAEWVCVVCGGTDLKHTDFRQHPVRPQQPGSTCFLGLFPPPPPSLSAESGFNNNTTASSSQEEEEEEEKGC